MDSDGDGCGDNSDVWPQDATECFDRDYDGVGDNKDAFPDSAYEWLDSDGDGVGDNADAFPFDASAKYDSDGDGVPDATDLFPKNAGMDSFFDIGWRIGLGLALLASLLLFVQRRTSNDIDEQKWVMDANQQQAIESTARPLSAPTLDDFGQN